MKNLKNGFDEHTHTHSRIYTHTSLPNSVIHENVTFCWKRLITHGSSYITVQSSDGIRGEIKNAHANDEKRISTRVCNIFFYLIQRQRIFRNITPSSENYTIPWRMRAAHIVCVLLRIIECPPISGCVYQCKFHGSQNEFFCFHHLAQERTIA